MSMWEPFTKSARNCIVFAQNAAQSLGSNSIGTEHILLGILEEEDSLGAQSLREHGVTTLTARKAIESIAGVGSSQPSKQHEFVFTPEAKRMIEVAFEEARQLSHDYIGTGHLLLALMREREGVAARVVLDLADNPQTIRETIVKKIAEEKQDVDKPAPRRDKRDEFSIARCPHCHKPITIALFQAAEKL
jgi:ATP-dependent Clp protease ATP-binding subunit ClpC